MRRLLGLLKDLPKSLVERGMMTSLKDKRSELLDDLLKATLGKAQLTSRNAFGFRIYHGAEIALYHALGALTRA